MNLRQGPAPQTCIVVLGMHRSGTSALTGVLSLLGSHTGDALMPAMEGNNPKGFWEHAEIVSINDQLLEVFGSSWDDESPLPNQWWFSPLATTFRNRIISVLRRDFSNQLIWLIKDPRMCRLLPMWHGVLRELHCQPLFVLSLRSPAEVAHSLRKRDNLAEEASCLLWLTHMLEAEFQTRGQPRTFVIYEHLLSDWRDTVANISRTINLTWPVDAEDAAPDIEAFLDSSLRHHVGASLPEHPACRMAQEGFELLSASSPDKIKLDRLRTQTEALISLVAPWSKRLRHSERHIRRLESLHRTTIAHLESEKARLHLEIQRVKGTVSWQITKPLRLFAGLARSPQKALTELRGQPPATLQNYDYSALVPFDYPAVEWKSAPRLAIICHMFYIDMIDEFARYFSNIPFQFDLYITTDIQEKREKIEKKFSHWKGKIEVRIAPNRGRDIAPMLITCRDVYDHYEYILHIHTKKSPHNNDLSAWRFYLLETILGSTEVVRSVFEAFRSDPKLGMIAPQHFGAVHQAIGWDRNFKIAQTLAKKLGFNVSRHGPVDFPSGSMFWARTAAIKPLLECNLTLDEFPDEAGQVDKTLGHAVERLFYFVCEHAGFGWIKISRPSLLSNPASGKPIATHEDLINFIRNSQHKLIS